MNSKNLITFLLLLMLVARFSASADRFYVKSADLIPGKTGTLQFVLENSEDYYGFQAEVALPAGLKAVKGNSGELDIILSNRADDGRYMVNSNETAAGYLIMGAFSSNHKPFTGNSGVLVNLNVSVANDFAGGSVEISNIMFVNRQDKDVTFEPTSTSFVVTVKGITLSKTDLRLTPGETTALTAITPPGSTVVWTSSDKKVATVDVAGNVTAVGTGTATITATCGSASATCKVTVTDGISMGDADGNGMVDANDVVVMLNYYLGVIDSIDLAVSDLNGDGVIDSQDALTTSNIYLETTIK